MVHSPGLHAKGGLAVELNCWVIHVTHSSGECTLMPGQSAAHVTGSGPYPLQSVSHYCTH